MQRLRRLTWPLPETHEAPSMHVHLPLGDFLNFSVQHLFLPSGAGHLASSLKPIPGWSWLLHTCTTNSSHFLSFQQNSHSESAGHPSWPGEWGPQVIHEGSVEQTSGLPDGQCPSPGSQGHSGEPDSARMRAVGAPNAAATTHAMSRMRTEVANDMFAYGCSWTGS
jgi:hypothetical protein